MHVPLCCKLPDIARGSLTPERRLLLPTVKLHYAAHLGLFCKFYNPRDGWCYNDEDYMKRMAHMIGHTIKALGPLRVCTHFLQKHHLRLFIRFECLGTLM